MPTLYGQTEEAKAAKSAAFAKNWNEESVLAKLEARDSTFVPTAKTLIDWMRVNADQVLLGHGTVDGSISAMLLFAGEKLYPIMLSTMGKVYINFGYCKRGPFQDEAKRREWLERLNAGGLSLKQDCIDKYPGVPLAVLASPERMRNFLAVLDWFKAELRSGF